MRFRNCPAGFLDWSKREELCNCLCKKIRPGLPSGRSVCVLGGMCGADVMSLPCELMIQWVFSYKYVVGIIMWYVGYGVKCKKEGGSV